MITSNDRCCIGLLVLDGSQLKNIVSINERNTKIHIVKATLFDRRGNIIVQAHNNYTKSHPLQARFALQVNQPDRIFLHAELSCLTKLKKRDRPHKIKVERYRKDGTPGNAKPCLICEAALKSYGIKLIEYTI